MLKQFSAALALGLLLGAPGFAQSSLPSSSSSASAASAESAVPDDLQTFVGDWLLEQEDQSLPRCAISFTDQPVEGGFAATFPETCPPPYPTDKIVAWNVDDTDFSILLLDAGKHVVVRLYEDEDGLYDTPEGTVPRFYLLSPVDENGAGGEQDTD